MNFLAQKVTQKKIFFVSFRTEFLGKVKVMALHTISSGDGCLSCLVLVRLSFVAGAWKRKQEDPYQHQQRSK